MVAAKHFLKVGSEGLRGDSVDLILVGSEGLRGNSVDLILALHNAMHLYVQHNLSSQLSETS